MFRIRTIWIRAAAPHSQRLRLFQVRRRVIGKTRQDQFDWLDQLDQQDE